MAARCRCTQVRLVGPWLTPLEALRAGLAALAWREACADALRQHERAAGDLMLAHARAEVELMERRGDGFATAFLKSALPPIEGAAGRALARAAVRLGRVAPDMALGLVPDVHKVRLSLRGAELALTWLHCNPECAGGWFNVLELEAPAQLTWVAVTPGGVVAEGAGMVAQGDELHFGEAALHAKRDEAVAVGVQLRAASAAAPRGMFAAWSAGATC